MCNLELYRNISYLQNKHLPLNRRLLLLVQNLLLLLLVTRLKTVQLYREFLGINLLIHIF